MTFQSVSPSSIKARVPNTFTLITSPREHTWGLNTLFWKGCKNHFSKTLHTCPVPYLLCRIYRWDHCLHSIPCRCPCGWGLPMSVKEKRAGLVDHGLVSPLNIHSLSGTCLWYGAVIPDITFVGKHIGHITKVALLHVLLQRIERVFGGNLWKT